MPMLTADDGVELFYMEADAGLPIMFVDIGARRPRDQRAMAGDILGTK